MTALGRLVLGTRGSALALAQSRGVAARLEAAHPGLKVEVVVLKTSGDRLAEVSLAGQGGKGLFTKELEEALLQGRADLAVHSLKDLPTELPESLGLAAVTEREDFRDAWISAGPGLGELPAGARVGTGSPRRRVQLLALRPDLEVVELRGNVDTRLAKIRSGEVAAGVLAAAGLARLGRLAEATSFFGPDEMLPAPGQGFLGLEARRGSAGVWDLVASLGSPRAWSEAGAERAFLAALGGGCQAPVAALARTVDGELLLKGLVSDPGGSRLLRGEVRGPAGDWDRLGRELAGRLLEQGGRGLLEGLE